MKSTLPIPGLAWTMILSLFAGGLLFGCAASGPKYINLAYEGSPSPASPATFGISRFSDNRTSLGRGELGHRVLNDKSKEVFLVQGLDLAGSLTDQTQIYLERKGLIVSVIPHWSPDLAGMKAAGPEKDYVLTGRINQFHCRAVKNGALTEMILKVDLTLFLGDKSGKKLSTIPVALTMERTDVNFTREKVEDFFNQTLTEVLEKALPFY